MLYSVPCCADFGQARDRTLRYLTYMNLKVAQGRARCRQNPTRGPKRGGVDSKRANYQRPHFLFSIQHFSSTITRIRTTKRSLQVRSHRKIYSNHLVFTLYITALSGTSLLQIVGSKQHQDLLSMSTQPLLASAPGKRIALPTRVEPKVFFANERTFLSWLNFTVILGGLAIGLLNFGDNIGRICAGLFTIVAMGAMVYALATFHWRAKTIRLRGQSGFDDRYGPTVLAIALAGAVIVNFVLRIVES